MSNRQDNRVCARRGVAFVITLFFLSLIACLAVAIAATADSNLTIARNRIEGQQASAFAATGIQLMQFSLGGMPAGGAVDASTMNTLIRNHLLSKMVPGWTASTIIALPNDAGVTLPPITLKSADGRDGTVDVTIHATLDGKTVRVTSVARYPVDPNDPDAPAAQRIATYTMAVQVQSVAGHLPPFGVATKGIISMGGNASIRGPTDHPHDGDVLSAYYSPLPPSAPVPAVQLTANARIGGDVNIVDGNGTIYKKSNASIGGTQNKGFYADGRPVDEPQWPKVDITQFKQYATNAYGSGLSNIRIPPNTNPTFSGNVTIRGVVYIQAPNVVTFSGNTTIIGTIVTDQPDVDNLTANQIKFTGNVITSGVENLPAGAQYDGLRALTGSFLLAPGFSTQFTGNFGTVNGCMIASEFKFGGNAGGTIKGGVVNLSGSLFEIGGNANLIIDREGAVEEPAGIYANSTRLVCVRRTYAE